MDNHKPGHAVLSATATPYYGSCDNEAANDEAHGLLIKPDTTLTAPAENTDQEWVDGHTSILLWGLIVVTPYLIATSMSDGHTLLEHTLPDLGWTLLLYLALLLVFSSDKGYQTDALFPRLFTGIVSIVCACIGIPMHRPGVAAGGAMAISLTAGVLLLIGPEILSGLQRPPWVPYRHRRTFALCLLTADAAASMFVACYDFFTPLTRLQMGVLFALYLSTMIAWSTLRWGHKVTGCANKHNHVYLVPCQLSEQVLVHVWNNNPASPMFIAGAFLLSALIAGGYMLWDRRAGTLPSESEGEAEKQDVLQFV